MKKGVFEVLHEMNKEDGENKTTLVMVCTTLISADKTKQGTKVVMGAPTETLMDLMSNKSMAVLLIIDKKEYFKRINS